MKKTNITPINSSRDFEFHEKFFSITDRKGIIKCCNDVFIRVSDYASQEILGEPHNIVRHPEMPRCVFKLLWDYLLADKPIGAYVKNMAKTGEYYWVYALASPVKDGFLSIRIKPQSGFFDIIKALYKELKDHEDSFGSRWKEGMESSTGLLLKKLKELGYEGYDDFMSDSLRQEFSLHLEACNVKNSGSSNKYITETDNNMTYLTYIFSNIECLNSLKADLSNKQHLLDNLNKNLKMIALNSGIQASHLGDNGRSLVVVSNEISRISYLVSEQMKKLTHDTKSLAESLKAASFYCSLSLLQNSMQDEFTSYKQISDLDEESQINQLGQSLSEIHLYLEDTAKTSYQLFTHDMSKMSKSISDFDDFLASLARIVQSLDFSYVTGKTLAAQTENGTGFFNLISTLKQNSDQANMALYELRMSLELVQSKLSLTDAEIRL